MLRRQLNFVLGLMTISACVSRASAEPIAAAAIGGGADSQFCELAKLLADDGVADDAFGATVSVSGDVALVGAPGGVDDTGPGSAYVFRWNGTAWVQEEKLLADDGAAGARFGTSVSISGDVVLVGAPGNAINPNSGSAYVFRWNGTSWIQEQKLLPDDGAAGDEFGVRVGVRVLHRRVGLRRERHSRRVQRRYARRWNSTGCGKPFQLAARKRDCRALCSLAGEIVCREHSIRGPRALVICTRRVEGIHS